MSPLCTALAGLVPVGAAPRVPVLDRDPRNAENWPCLGVSSQHGGGQAGSGVRARVCLCTCVLHTPKNSSMFHHLYSSLAASLTSSPPNFSAFSQIAATLFLGAGAGLRSPRLHSSRLPGRGQLGSQSPVYRQGWYVHHEL